MRVIAYDDASPARVATSTVDIVVTRNPSAPIFTSSIYQQTIAETYSLGAIVLTVSASDQDGVRSSLEKSFYFDIHFINLRFQIFHCGKW